MSGNKDVSVVDSLSVKLFMELTMVLDQDEAKCQEAELWKAQKKTVSNILVPSPPLDVPSDLVHVPQTQQYAAIQNPLSALSGNIVNNMSSLEEEMTAAVTPKMLKRQCLTIFDCGDAINKFTEKSSGF